MQDKDGWYMIDRQRQPNRLIDWLGKHFVGILFLIRCLSSFLYHKNDGRMDTQTQMKDREMNGQLLMTETEKLD